MEVGTQQVLGGYICLVFGNSKVFCNNTYFAKDLVFYKLAKAGATSAAVAVCHFHANYRCVVILVMQR